MTMFVRVRDRVTGNVTERSSRVANEMVDTGAGRFVIEGTVELNDPPPRPHRLPPMDSRRRNRPADDDPPPRAA